MGKKQTKPKRQRYVIIEVEESENKQWFFHLLWTNGRVALVSENYTRFAAAFKLACQFHEMMVLPCRLVVPEAKQKYLQRYLDRM